MNARFFLAPEHRAYFAKEKQIAFEDLLPRADLEKLRSSLDLLLAKRLKVAPEKLGDKAADALFPLCRDLWRDDRTQAKLLLPTPLFQVAASLLKTNNVRLAFTHYIRPARAGTLPFKKESLTLKQMSSFGETRGGILLNLHTGSALFLHPECALTPHSLFQADTESLCLFVLSTPKTLYLSQPEDPLGHLLKKEGYVFGDLLREETHPLLRN